MDTELFGLHENAAISSANFECELVINCLLLAGGGGANKINNDNNKDNNNNNKDNNSGNDKNRAIFERAE